MNRRLLAAIFAAVFALAGAGLLAVYVTSADARAMSSQSPTDVYVVVKDVARGTAAEALGDSVQKRQLPKAAVPAGAVSSLDQIKGKVATTDLLVGEQLLAARFAEYAALNHDLVPVPKEFQQITVQLNPERAKGGSLKAGDLVGFLVTVDVEAQESAAPNATKPVVGDKKVTRTILSKVLVTRVQGGVVSPDTASASAAAEAAPNGSVLVTVALSAADTEKLVWAIESGSVYLAAQTDTTDVSAVESATGISGRVVFP